MQLGPLTETEELIPYDHHTQVRYTIIDDYFQKQNEEREPINFWWGAEYINKKNRNYWDIE